MTLGLFSPEVELCCQNVTENLQVMLPYNGVDKLLEKLNVFDRELNGEQLEAIRKLIGANTSVFSSGPHDLE